MEKTTNRSVEKATHAVAVATVAALWPAPSLTICASSMTAMSSKNKDNNKDQMMT